MATIPAPVEGSSHSQFSAQAQTQVKAFAKEISETHPVDLLIVTAKEIEALGDLIAELSPVDNWLASLLRSFLAELEALK